MRAPLTKIGHHLLAVLVAGGLLSGLGDPLQAKEVLIPAKAVRDSDAEKPKLYVVAVGAATFQDSFWPDLKWSEKDATKVAEMLGLKTDRKRVVTLLTGTSATREEVSQTLAKIARRARPEDAVVVYLSTHGTLAIAEGSDLEPVMVLANTSSQDLQRTGLSGSMLRRSLDRIPAAQKVLILAACHSGLGKSRLTPPVQEILSGSKGRPTKLEDVSEGFLVLSAAARGETAREDDPLQGDVYTHYFLEALTTFDRNRDGTVSALEAHDYARDHAFARTNGRQRATLEMQAIGHADLSLYGRVSQPGVPVLEARADELAGLYVSVDRGAKGRLPTVVALRPGQSTVSFYHADQTKAFATYEVSAPPGKHVELAELVAGPRWTLGLGLGSVFFPSSKSQNTAGRGLTRLTMQAGYRATADIRLGLEVSTMTSRKTSRRPGITSQLSIQRLEVYGEYTFLDWRLKGFDWGGGAAMGESTAALTLRDTSDALFFKATTLTVAPYGFVDWTSSRGLVGRLSARYDSGTYDFGDPGRFDGRYAEIAIHALYRFGGIARRQ